VPIQQRLEHALDEAGPAREHTTNTERSTTSSGRPLTRGTCACGWRGHWRTSLTRGWDAQADADQHHNGEH
jgi:hypothetical protein